MRSPARFARSRGFPPAPATTPPSPQTTPYTHGRIRAPPAPAIPDRRRQTTLRSHPHAVQTVRIMGRFIEGVHRTQSTRLTPCLDDWIDEDRAAPDSVGTKVSFEVRSSSSARVLSWPDCDMKAGAQTAWVAGYGRSKNRRCKCWFSAIQRRSPWATVHTVPAMTGGAHFGLLQYVGHVRPE